MRVDDYLSTVGVVKRRTVAKDLATSGMVAVNGQTVKAAYQVKPGDIIQIKGAHGRTVEVIDLPNGSVSKTERDRYFKELSGN